MSDEMVPGDDRSDDGPALTRGERVLTYAVGTLIVITLLSIVLYSTVAVRVLPGEVGVRFSLLFGGTVLDRVIPPGFALKLPWDRVYMYEVRTQRTPFVLAALSQDDMQLQITASVLFQVKPEEAPKLHEAIGPEYAQRVVQPVAIAGVREAASSQVAFTLYAESFGAFKTLAMQQLADHPVSEYVTFVDLAITEVRLPQRLTDAIEDKLSQEQLFESFQYRLRSQAQEAERRRIEAIGIRVFYDIVRQALTPDLLTWRGIEATVQLARSRNSKLVVVGGGQDQLPLILGESLTAQSAEPATNDDTHSADDPNETDELDTDPSSFAVDSNAFPQLPDFRSLPSLFDDSTFLPQSERAATRAASDGTAPTSQSPPTGLQGGPTAPGQPAHAPSGQ